MRVGIYVHHSGSGHGRRAASIAQAVRERGAAVSVAGSSGVVDLSLPRDDEPPAQGDATARGALHWAPLRHHGMRERSQLITRWVAEERLDVVVVDVSVEVAALVRLLGVPVVVVTQPGDRTDRPHALAYDLAEVILAPWPDGFDAGPHVGRWREKVVAVGGISAFTTRSRAERPSPASPYGVLLAGGDGWPDPTLPQRISCAVPALTWHTLGGEHWLDDPEDLLRGADVVISHAGQNAVADLAAADAPSIVVAMPRPFDEQRWMVRGLAAGGWCTGIDDASSLADADWAALVRRATTMPRRWTDWHTEGAASRAADIILDVAHG